jgi:hypothetical protein
MAVLCPEQELAQVVWEGNDADGAAVVLEPVLAGHSRQDWT